MVGKRYRKRLNQEKNQSTEMENLSKKNEEKTRKRRKQTGSEVMMEKPSTLS